jgi:hypothetical protein
MKDNELPVEKAALYPLLLLQHTVDRTGALYEEVLYSWLHHTGRNADSKMSAAGLKKDLTVLFKVSIKLIKNLIALRPKGSSKQKDWLTLTEAEKTELFKEISPLLSDYGIKHIRFILWVSIQEVLAIEGTIYDNWIYRSNLLKYYEILLLILEASFEICLRDKI